MWLDTDTDEDYLNFGETAELVEAILREPAMLPVSIGVYGGWGSGKSTILRLVEQRVAALPGETPSFVVVNFDAWLYQDFDDARAALMESIGTALGETVKGNDSALGVLKRFMKRVDGFRVLVGAADIGLSLATGGITRGWLGSGFAAARRVVSGQGAETDAEPILGSVKALGDIAAGVLAPEAETPTQQINAFRKDFADLMKASGCTLVVFIDNLDRCLPRNAIQTLEAIRLFLFMPRTAFVVAADEDMVRHAVKEHFSASSEDRHVADYLDKLIQVPVRVPRLGEHEVRTYMYHLFSKISGLSEEECGQLRHYTEGQLRQSWKSEPYSKEDFLKVVPDHPATLPTDLDLADRLAPLLAKASKIDGNPRTIKRMLNAVRMRSKLSKQRGMNLNDAVLAKLAVFERCTDQASTVALFSSISASRDGHSLVLKAVEAEDFDVERLPTDFPEPWRKKEHLLFIRSWVLLEPRLAGTDLRPAVYLSRETAVLNVSRAGLSPAGTEILRLLLKALNTGLPVCAREAKRLSADEVPIAMKILIEEMRKVDDWSRKFPAFNGAHTLAEVQPDSRQLLVEYVQSLPSQPPWLKPLMKNFIPKAEV